jgi:hypothetical protein
MPQVISLAEQRIRKMEIMEEFRLCLPWLHPTCSKPRDLWFSRFVILYRTVNALAMTYPDLTPAAKHKLLLEVRRCHRELMSVIPAEDRKPLTAVLWQLFNEVLQDEEQMLKGMN